MLRRQFDKQRKKFGAISILYVSIMTVIYIIIGFASQNSGEDNSLSDKDVLAIENFKVFAIIGFGFFFNLIKNCTWSTFLNTILIFLFSFPIYIPIKTLMPQETCYEQSNQIQDVLNSLKSALPAIIAYGALIGRISPNQIFAIAIFGTSGYTFLERLTKHQYCMFDDGGTITIFLFGSIYGITLNKMISYKINPSQKRLKQIKQSHKFQYLSMIGVIFLYAFWPAFNCPVNRYKITQNTCDCNTIIVNTIFSFVGSIIGGFIFHGFNDKKFIFNEFINIALSGGIIAGSCAGLSTNIITFLALGLLGSYLCCFSMEKLRKWFQVKIGMIETLDILHSITMPSILGGIFILLTFGKVVLSNEQNLMCLSPFLFEDFTITGQLILQFFGIFMTIISAILIGALVGVVLNFCFLEEQRQIAELLSDATTDIQTEKDEKFLFEDKELFGETEGELIIEEKLPERVRDGQSKYVNMLDFS